MERGGAIKTKKRCGLVCSRLQRYYAEQLCLKSCKVFDCWCCEGWMGGGISRAGNPGEKTMAVHNASRE
jgi:hypothetical protein